MQPRHFRWVPHVLTRELRDGRVPGARALFDVLRHQEKAHFRDIVTGDESWIFIDTAPNSIWLWLDEELPTRPRRTISADKRVLIAFWGIKGPVHVNWLPKDGRINPVYLRDEILMPISHKLQTNVSGRHKPSTLVQTRSRKVHTAEMVSSVVPKKKFKRIPQPPYSSDIYPSDFFLSRWFKGKLQQQFTDPGQLFEAVDEIFGSLSVDMMGDVFQNWIHRFVQVLDPDGYYI